MGMFDKIFGAVGGIAGSAIPVIGTAAGTAIGSGLGTGIDSFITEKRSDRNDKEARLWQEAMYDKQFENNKQLWYEQQEYLNDYNSPENQVKRLRDAGINPQLALGNVTTGSAQGGSTLGASMPNGSPSSRTPFGEISATLDDMVSAQNQQDLLKEDLRKKKAESRGLEIDNLTRFTENLIRIQDMIAGVNNKNSSTAKNWTDKMVAELMATPQFLNLYQDLANKVTQNELLTVQALTSWQELKFLPVQQQIEYEEWVQRLDNMYQQGELTKQQVKTEIERTNSEKYSALGKKWLNSLNEKTESFILEKSQNEAYWSRYTDSRTKLQQSGVEGFNKFMDEYIFKPSKKAWKDTRRSLVLPWD